MDRVKVALVGVTTFALLVGFLIVATTYDYSAGTPQEEAWKSDQTKKRVEMWDALPGVLRSTLRKEKDPDELKEICRNKVFVNPDSRRAFRCGVIMTSGVSYQGTPKREWELYVYAFKDEQSTDKYGPLGEEGSAFSDAHPDKMAVFPVSKEWIR